MLIPCKKEDAEYRISFNETRGHLLYARDKFLWFDYWVLIDCSTSYDGSFEPIEKRWKLGDYPPVSIYYKRVTDQKS